MASIPVCWQLAICLVCTLWIPAEARGDTSIDLIPNGDLPFDNGSGTTEPPVVTPIDCSNGSNVDARCQQCCVVEGPEGPQGPQGQQGVPGIQGMKGDQGLAGVCESQCINGEPGQKGARGAPGQNGIKGDRGIDGAPGFRGVTGLPGPKGDRGSLGWKGQSGRDGSNGLKGEKGEPGEGSTTYSTSAFYVGRYRNLLRTSGSETITFDRVFTNTGNDFNANTGIFTCRIPGLYHFSYTFRAYRHSTYGLNVDLYVNRDKKAEIYLQGINKNIMQSQTAVLNLQAHDQVKLIARAYTYIYGCPTHNTFSGHLIQAN